MTIFIYFFHFQKREVPLEHFLQQNGAKKWAVQEIIYIRYIVQRMSSDNICEQEGVKSNSQR